jgi:hypothetical protein
MSDAKGKKLKAESKTPEELANQWIAELTEAGYSYDDMISLFKEARRMYNDYKNRLNKIEDTRERIRNFKAKMIADGYEPK